MELVAVLVFCILLIGGGCYFFMYLTKQEKQKKQAHKDLMKEKNATLTVKLPHISGLNLPDNADCTIFSCKNNYEFNANGVSFNLKKEKILDISLKSETDIQKQKVSSIGGAIIGEKLFGDLGAIIGGRAKTHDIKTTTYYLIFTYQKDNNPDFLIFNATDYQTKSYKFVEEFKENKPTKENISIEL